MERRSSSCAQGVSVSGLAVCDPLVGVVASARGWSVQIPLLNQLYSYRQKWSAEFPPSVEVGEGDRPGLIWCCIATTEAVLSSRVGIV